MTAAETHHNRSSRSRGIRTRWIRPERRLAIYLRDGFRCAHCLRDLRRELAWSITLDHIVTRVRGGSNRSDNLVTSCRRCNSARQGRVLAGDDRARIVRIARRSIAVHFDHAKSEIAAAARLVRDAGAGGVDVWPLALRRAQERLQRRTA